MSLLFQRLTGYRRQAKYSFYSNNDPKHVKTRAWLSAPDSPLNHNDACKKRQPKTGSWFVASPEFSAWKTNPDSFLWLHGIAGCGKTILSSTIIEDVFRHCHLKSTYAVVYFYFDFNDDEKQLHEKMIRSLISQLSAQSGNASKLLETLFSSCLHGERQPTRHSLLLTLRKMVEEFAETFIILDALDECVERKELLADIKEIAKWKLGKLHMLVTSRREIDIERSLGPLINDHDEVCIQDDLVNDDIRAYVRQRLETDEELARWRSRPEVQDEIETKLMEKANGM